MKLKKHPIRNSIILVIIILIVTISVIFSLKKPVPQPVLTAPAIQSDLEDTVLATGVLQPIRQVDVGAQVSGQLKKLWFKEGDKVKKGQLLAEIDPQLIENDLKASEASLEALSAQKMGKQVLLQQQQTELKRQQEMMKNHATSEKDLLAAQTNVRSLQADLAALQAQIREGQFQVDRNRTNLGYTKIVAPMDGEVMEIVTQEGQTVIAAQQAPVILRLANMANITVKAQVSEADIIRVHPDQTAYFSILGNPDKRYWGQIRTIWPTPDTVNNAIFYRVLFDIPNPKGELRANMTADVKIVMHSAKNALNIPINALAKTLSANQYEVKVQDKQGASHVRRITTGLKTATRIQVISGLKAGEQVILNPLDDNANADAKANNP